MWFVSFFFFFLYCLFFLIISALISVHRLNSCWCRPHVSVFTFSLSNFNLLSQNFWMGSLSSCILDYAFPLVFVFMRLFFHLVHPFTAIWCTAHARNLMWIIFNIELVVVWQLKLIDNVHVNWKFKFMKEKNN